MQKFAKKKLVEGRNEESKDRNVCRAYVHTHTHKEITHTPCCCLSSLCPFECTIWKATCLAFGLGAFAAWRPKQHCIVHFGGYMCAFTLKKIKLSTKKWECLFKKYFSSTCQKEMHLVFHWNLYGFIWLSSFSCCCSVCSCFYFIPCIHWDRVGTFSISFWVLNRNIHL